jgi:hypothetical protein
LETLEKKMIHCLKTHPEPFKAILRGEKRHEFRRNDRGFKAGDVLRLVEYGLIYSGRSFDVNVTYISHGPEWGIPEGFCVMSIESLGEWESCIELRERLFLEHGIKYSPAAFSEMLTKLRPPGVELRFARNRRAGTRRRIDLVRATPEFFKWIVAHARQWKKAA